jgi:hypothetical protein
MTSYVARYRQSFRPPRLGTDVWFILVGRNAQPRSTESCEKSMHCTLIDDCLAASEDVKDYINSRGSTNSSQHSYTTYRLSLRYWQIRSCIWGKVRYVYMPLPISSPVHVRFCSSTQGSGVLSSPPCCMWSHWNGERRIEFCAAFSHKTSKR